MFAKLYVGRIASKKWVGQGERYLREVPQVTRIGASELLLLTHIIGDAKDATLYDARTESAKGT